MRAGELRHRLVIESPQRVNDGAGGAITTWLEVATIWANVQPVTAREQRSADQRTQKTSHRITVRYREDINSTMRFTGEGRIFDIEAIINDAERDHWLVCFCVEGITA